MLVDGKVLTLHFAYVLLSSVKTMAKYSHTFERIVFHVDVLVVTVAVIC